MSEQDHRSRVGARRRAKTRNRLIEAAIPVFAEKGVDAPVIDDVIRSAGVSRGTFYNHFQSNHDLLLALSHQLRDELVFTMSRVVADIPDPAEKIAVLIGLLFRFGHDHPLLAHFVTQVGLEAAGPERLLGGFLASLLQEAIDQGRLPDIAVLPALDMAVGSMMCAFYRITNAENMENYAAPMVATVLRGFGLPMDEASRLSTLPPRRIEIHPDCTLMLSTATADFVARGA